MKHERELSTLIREEIEGIIVFVCVWTVAWKWNNVEK